MSSELKSETARTNGAKSHGPVTPEGKARSAANSRRHGLTASVLLDGETDEDIRLLLADFMDQFQPQTGVETDLVEVMAIARWRLRRLLAIETHLFGLEMVSRRKQIDADFTGMEPEDRLAFVFQRMSDTGNSLALLIRYEGSINRSYDKALKHLLQLQSSRQNLPPGGPLGSFGIFEPEAASNRESVTATDVDNLAATTRRPILPYNLFAAAAWCLNSLTRMDLAIPGSTVINTICRWSFNTLRRQSRNSPSTRSVSANPLGSAFALTSAMNWYPRRGSVSMKRGFFARSPSLLRMSAI